MGDDATPDTERNMSDIRHAAPTTTLEEIHDELATMGFGDPDQDINGGDFVEYGGQLFEDLAKTLAMEASVIPMGVLDEREHDRRRNTDRRAACPTMAVRWVALFTEWNDGDLTSTYNFSDWLDKHHEGERETLSWIASWDARPVDKCLRASYDRATAFAIMDFGDGSIAIRRNFGDDLERHTWMVAA